MATALEFLARERCSAILRTDLADAVEPAMQAAVTGGFRVVEVTLTTPRALEVIAQLSRQSDLLVGAGTVLTPADAEAAHYAGARFLVSPVVDDRVIRYAVAHDLVAVPGCYTPTEMLAAHRAGAQIVKLFPGPADGPGHVRACLGPLPFLRIFPTSGVTETNAAAHLEAGAFGVGFVGSLFEPADLAAGDFERIRQRAERMVEAVRSAGPWRGE
ncbi:MAG: bifunctional 4-hydroxy-2-oxoglutarate aldolase/2-dehydro-3-deoxy-phosphogluconate aldolase [Planctomycetota bacterium]